LGFATWNASTIACWFLISDGSPQIVFYRSPGGHLLESWYAGSWNGPVDWTASAFGGNGPVTSSPSATVLPNGSQQLVFWQGSGSTLWEAWYAGGRWNGPVNWSLPVTQPTSTTGWPGPSNTGVPAGIVLTTYTGPMTITTCGTVIEAKTVDGSLMIRTGNGFTDANHPCVTIRDSLIKGSIDSSTATSAACRPSPWESRP